MFFEISKIIGFLAAPSNALMVMALLGVGLALRWHRLGGGLAVAGLLGLAVAGWSPLGQALILPLEQRFAAFVDDGRPVDGIVILGGALDTLVSQARGTPALNEAAERMTAAVSLARRYPQARIVFSGGEARLIFEGMSEADAARQLFANLGLDPSRLQLEGRSRNTRENAQFTAAMVQPKQGERWLLVTSAFHMPRAMGCFRAAGFQPIAYPVDFRTRGRDDLLRGFDTAGEGLRRSDLAMREYIGLVIYRLAGFTDALFPAP
jgi:uncharacterized SAM-binding protein YcdF (DUF218 family)